MRNLIIVLLVALAVFAFQTDVVAQDGGGDPEFDAGFNAGFDEGQLSVEASITMWNVLFDKAALWHTRYTNPPIPRAVTDSIASESAAYQNGYLLGFERGRELVRLRKAVNGSVINFGIGLAVGILAAVLATSVGSS